MDHTIYFYIEQQIIIKYVDHAVDFSFFFFLVKKLFLFCLFNLFFMRSISSTENHIVSGLNNRITWLY